MKLIKRYKELKQVHRKLDTALKAGNGVGNMNVFDMCIAKMRIEGEIHKIEEIRKR
jgi:hypothetical protein